jgi:hypothetical protein
MTFASGFSRYLLCDVLDALQPKALNVTYSECVQLTFLVWR